MIRALALALGAVATMTTPAAADFWLQMGDRWVYVSNGLVILVVVFVVVVIIIAAAASDSAEKSEQSASQSADHFDNEAARLRALKRKLDAQTELTESQIRAALKDDEAKEICELIRHGRAKRRR
jgi:flagellar biosynthesis/type III secretory pathway M-ring protein FliF/YscJ